LQFVSPTKVLPQILPFNFGEEVVNLDDLVSISCAITKGDLPLKIWWTLTDSQSSLDKNLTSNDGVMITRNSQKVSVLTIEQVQARHRGNYTCHAENKAGVAEYSAYLSMNG